MVEAAEVAVAAAEEVPIVVGKTPPGWALCSSEAQKAHIQTRRSARRQCPPSLNVSPQRAVLELGETTRDRHHAHPTEISAAWPPR